MIRIEDKAKCCGCGACAARCPKGCIHMQPDDEGFLYPRTDTTACVACGRCEEVCPELNPLPARKPLRAVAAVCQDEALRLQSSSGGIFSLLAETVLARGGVVFGARFDKQWQVITDYTESLEGLAAFRGSKYVQAAVGGAYKDCERFLKEGREVLFSGTPCQIAGLQGFLGRDYKTLTLVDVACVGVPGPGLWHDYLSALTGARTELIRDVRFRDKSAGWRDSRFVLQYAAPVPASRTASETAGPSAAASSKTERLLEISMPRYKNPFFQALNTGLTARPGCYTCRFKSEGRSGSDLTLADCWGVEQLLAVGTPGVPTWDNGCPTSLLTDDKGTSLVIARSEKGARLLDSLGVTGCDCDYAAAVALNAGLRAGALRHPGREDFFRQYARLRERAAQAPAAASCGNGTPAPSGPKDSLWLDRLLKKAVTPPLHRKILNKLSALAGKARK